MPTKVAFAQMIANQMMRGPHYGVIPGTPEERERFKARFEKEIEWAIEELPRCSAAVAAVIVKCIIKYGKNKVADFCSDLKNKRFNGLHDPVYMLWKFLQKHRGKDTPEVYKRTVCATKAFMEGRKTLCFLRPSRLDVFDWEDNYAIPKEFAYPENSFAET